MRAGSFIVLFSVLLASVSAGTIRGTVEARPPEGLPESSGSGGGYGSRKFKFLEKVEYEEMRDFVVYIDRVQMAPSAPIPHAEVIQKDGTFLPRVLPVVAGTEVDFLNVDEIFHNVFSMSEVCEFDLGLYKKGDGKKAVTFNLPGRVDVFCSIHAKMSCVILVLPNPWFARADERGNFEIRGIPPGKYRLKAWHERVPAQVQEVEVGEDTDLKVNFILGAGRT